MGAGRRAIVGAALLVALVAAGLTGLLADLLDLNRLIYHRYAAYLALVLALLYAYLNRRALVAAWRGLPEVAGRLGRPRPSAVLPTPLPDQPPPLPLGPFGLRLPRLHLPWGAGVTRRGLGAAIISLATGVALGRATAPPGASVAVGEEDPDRAYHRWSQPDYAQLVGSAITGGLPPPAFKTYPADRRIPLPKPSRRPGLSVEEAIASRRSRRVYGGEPLALAELADLLYYAGGITAAEGLRAAPSAGGLYPIEIYPLVNRVGNLAPGAYHYAAREHALDMIRPGHFARDVVHYAAGQAMVGEAQAAILLTAVFGRTRHTYAARAYRYVLLEAGHIAQNIYLAATSAGLSACAVGAFFDGDFNRLLDLDGQEEAIVYLLTVGRS